MDGTPLFPIVVKDADFTPPATDTWFVVAGNGVFMERKTALYTATVRVDGGVPGLLPHEPRLLLRLPRLPRALIEQAVGFFREAHRRWDGEAIVVMYYLPADAERPMQYEFVAPPQTIRGRWEYGRFRADLRLDYQAATPPGEGWRKLGTFHSHGHLSPRHSAIDEHDELFETGLHLTAGYVDSARPEFEGAFVVNGARFRVPPERVMSPFRSVRPWPEAWLARVKVVEERWAPASGYGSSGYAGHGGYEGWGDGYDGYHADDPSDAGASHVSPGPRKEGGAGCE
jgi:hypothetical protein